MPKHNKSVKAVIVPYPAESVAKAENKEATAKAENKEATAKVKNPGEGKC
jgi:cbb3-type cytochrome oxidase cytochrome c subunit